MSGLLVLQGAGKRYPTPFRRGTSERWSLRGVDLDVRAGEIVAVIGRNGAGKSTLLKLAAGVSPPTEGSVRRTAKVAPLIEVGAGFHPELTGRQNVMLNGRLLGMSKAEVQAKLDSIVAFSELERVVDDPVKTYSSGMFMRLGFAVAVHTEPELLLVDEVLAVGDLPFQLKCLDRIRELREAGTGVLFVSHNLVAVQSLASRALLLESGLVRAQGPAREVIADYHAMLAVGDRGAELGEDGAVEHGLHLADVEVLDGQGQAPPYWSPGDRVHVRLTVQANEDVGPSLLGTTLRKEGAGVVGSWLALEGPQVPAFRRGERRVVGLSLALNVVQGSYQLDAGLASADGKVVHFEQQVATLSVGHRPGTSGLVDLAPVMEEA